MALDKINGVSIKKQKKLKELNIDLKSFEDLIKLFLNNLIEMVFFSRYAPGQLFVDNRGNIIPVTLVSWED